LPEVSDDQEVKVAEVLFKSMDPLSEAERSELLSQYQLCIEMADRVSARRQTANSFYLSISALLLGSFAIVGGSSVSAIDTFIACSVGIGFCLLWRRNILSYSQLNSGKFAVILEMEKRLVSAPFDAEWEALSRGRKSWKYRPFKHVEQLIPFFFGALFLMLFLRSLGIVEWLFDKPA
jgi:hypothetical protein